jgi:hypothetical protein
MFSAVRWIAQGRQPNDVSGTSSERRSWHPVAAPGEAYYQPLQRLQAFKYELMPSGDQRRQMRRPIPFRRWTI